MVHDEKKAAEQLDRAVDAAIKKGQTGPRPAVVTVKDLNDSLREDVRKMENSKNQSRTARG